MKQLSTEVRLLLALIALLLIALLATTASSRASREKRHVTHQRVTELAERLDGQVERGRYKRVDPAAVTDSDSWGRRISVEYRDEGIGERLIVRSAGPDGSFGTYDDIAASRFLMNAKGIGEEIKDGTASVAKEAARGFVRGVKEEVKESLKPKPPTEQPK